MNKFAWLLVFLFLLPMTAQAKVEPHVRKALGAAVKVLIPGLGSGSGFAFHRDVERNKTLIATNDHVCQVTRGRAIRTINYVNAINTYPIVVLTTNNKRYQARVAHTANKHLRLAWLWKILPQELQMPVSRDDLCILEIKEIMPTVKLGSTAELGEEVFSVSAPRGIWPILHMGYAGQVQYLGFQQNQSFSLYLTSGSSGGGIYNLNGEVVSIIYAIRLAVPNTKIPVISLGIPVERLKLFKKEYYQTLIRTTP